MPNPRSLLAWIAVGAIVALGSMPARADDTTAGIAVLKAELRRLEAKVDAQSKADAQTKAQLAANPLPTRKGAPAEITAARPANSATRV